MYPLDTVATHVTTGAEKMNKGIDHFMDYCASNPDTVKLYRACDMILMIHSDAVYLVEPEARIHAGELFYLGNKNGRQMNGSILILANIIKNVVS